MTKKARIIAFYLPQFHPIPENDEWCGKGFTEWTNVGKAKPLFKGHYQPRVPADLGYYDLRLPVVREQQAELAREAGVEGFMYWHYWFGNGKRLMANIFDEVLESKKPDFPFCLGWATESWYAKNWNASGVKKDKLLIEQQYGGIDDYQEHFQYLLKAFKDDRYIKINGAPLFMIWRPEPPFPYEIVELWNKWAKEAGFENGIYFVGELIGKKMSLTGKKELKERGFNAVSADSIARVYSGNTKLSKCFFRFRNIITKGIIMRAFDYKHFNKNLVDKEFDILEDVIPKMVPNWDHSPRSGKKYTLLYNSTPKLFKEHVKRVLDIIAKKENKLVFLKSWNEWAEGNYMEPDLKFGKGYIKALREALDEN